MEPTHHRRGSFLPLLLMMGLAAGCGGGDGGDSGCDPTDPACSSGGPSEDVTPPTVVSVAPADGATGVSRTSDVTVTFSEPVDPASVTATGFTVGSASGSINVSGATASFTPDAELDAGATYAVRVSGVRDTAGNAMTAAHTSSFTTVSPPAMADAGDDLDVDAGASVTLDGSGSSGANLAYTWTQLSGPTVGPLSGPSPSFTAPAEISTLAFELSVSDGATSSVDTVRVWVLEDAAHAYFVSPSGDDGNAGTRGAPLASVQAAIVAADNAGNGGDVYVAGGTYAEGLELRSRVSVYGGFDPADWERDISSFRPVIEGGASAVRGNIANNLTLEGLEILSADATAAGESSIALSLHDSEDVVVRRNRIAAGAGAAGGSGLAGSNGNRGGAGGGGANASSLCIPGSPGGGGAGSYISGGVGGDGGLYGGFDGESGSGPRGGARGRGGATYSDGGNGSAGGPGNPGSDGAAGAAFGSIAASGYVPSDGEDGGDGSHGSGGGGGGGGGGTAVSCGPGGGGGGGGGQRGTGATAGGGGGASIAILLSGTSQAQINDNEIATGQGGVGGPGGTGGLGGPGGFGGSGGNKGCEAPFNSPCTGWGGNGGNGGPGGRGGHGGGGGGGPSIGVVEGPNAGANADIASANSFSLGTAGAGGYSAAHGGADGEAVEHKKID